MRIGGKHADTPRPHWAQGYVATWLALPPLAGGASLDREGRSVAEKATLKHGFRERDAARGSVIENRRGTTRFCLRSEHLNQREYLTRDLRRLALHLNIGWGGGGFDVAARAKGTWYFVLRGCLCAAATFGIVRSPSYRTHPSQRAMIGEENPRHHEQRADGGAEGSMTTQGSHSTGKSDRHAFSVKRNVPTRRDVHSHRESLSRKT